MASLTEFEKMLLQTLEEKDQLIASMQATITSLQGSVDTMSATIAELNQVIEALKEQLKKNSNNSYPLNNLLHQKMDLKHHPSSPL